MAEKICPECNGKRLLNGKRCPMCNMKGTIKIEKKAAFVCDICYNTRTCVIGELGYSDSFS